MIAIALLLVLCLSLAIGSAYTYFKKENTGQIIIERSYRIRPK